MAAADIIADNTLYRELLQRWSMKNFSNHVAIQPPPDQRFFDTFLYVSPAAYAYLNEGLQHLKQRAIAEHIGYMETAMTRKPPCGRGPASRVPPSSMTRSRIPNRPCPVLGTSAPSRADPASLISIRRAPGR